MHTIFITIIEPYRNNDNLVTISILQLVTQLLDDIRGLITVVIRETIQQSRHLRT